MRGFAQRHHIRALHLLALLGLLGVVGVLAWYFATVDIHRLASGIEETAQRYRFWGYAAVFVIGAVSAASIFFPVPGLVVAVAVARALEERLGVAVVFAFGSTLGEFTGYLLGYLGRAVIAEKHLGRYHRAERWMERYGSFAILTFALLPFLPFDIVGIAAGNLRFPVWKFVLATWVGRIGRSVIEVYVGVSLWHVFFG